MGVYRLCRVFRSLPYPGGVMNQPRAAIERLEAIMDANDRWQEHESKQEEPEKK